MNSSQRKVAIGAASGVCAMAVSTLAIYHFWSADLALADTGARMAFTLQANAFAALLLLAIIMVVGNDRFLTEAIDPTLQK